MKYKFLVRVLKLFIYGKRLLWWIGGRIGKVVGRILGRLWHFLTYIRYRLGFRVRKAGLGHSGGWFTSRFFFQVFTLVIAIGAAYSHTKWFTPPENGTGQSWERIKLFKLIRTDVEIEDTLTLEVEEGSLYTPETALSWREGMVETHTDVGARPSGNRPETLGLALQGRAVVKPSLLPGGNVVRTRVAVEEYIVQVGDSIPSIAAEFGVSVETVLWENNLNIRDVIRPGKVLRIPPVTGVMHTVAKGDTVKKIADTYKANAGDIVAFNKLTPDGGGLVAGTRVVVPRGKKPAPPPSTAPATSLARGSGAGRPGTRSVAVATPPPSAAAPAASGFIWPAAVHQITQYFGEHGHTGLDIAGPGAFRQPTYAAQSGVVKYAGWQGKCAKCGYGNLVIIDHGNGIETYYGHHDQILVSVGQHVDRGDTLGLIGNTGHVVSLGGGGVHLHFEVRIKGKVVNPLGTYVR